jgi:hypothetical protein
MRSKDISRRQFIRNLSAAAMAPWLLSGAGVKAWAGTGKSRVVLVRDSDVLDTDGNPKEDVVLSMLDRGVTALTDRLDAWKSLVKPRDIVGIKSNVWNFLPTTPQVETALRKRVMDAGVKADAISVDDRGVLQNPVFRKATALINARPMRSHHWSGVGSLLKNYIQFVPNPSDYHPDSCADLAAIWKLPIVKDKTRLNVLVMFTPQFHGVGPHSFNPKYLWEYRGLLLGQDPVAVDATGLRIIEAIRREYFGEGRPLNPPAKHIRIADTRHHLGTADPNKIDLIKIGYDKQSFI